ncbi:MAG: heparinase II/III family protein [bacterium]|nr:heparinase II/III family protein [bacterium]
MQIPVDERAVSDEQFFQALDLEYPGMETVKNEYQNGQTDKAKKALLEYFEHRNQVHYLFDSRMLPLTPIDTDENPYSFQASLGLSGSLKEFCLYAGKKMMDYVYVIPGKGRGEVDLGEHFCHPIHFSFIRDKDKKKNNLNLFVRGTSFEYLYVLYHETGDVRVLERFEELLRLFFDTYPLTICNTAADAARFQFEDDRDVMSAGFLTLTYTSMLYTRVPYEIDPELAFGILKRLWFIGIQFRRFDTDTYRPYNHHMWERGLVPFILGTMFPEIPAFRPMKSIGASVVCQHIRDDFNEAGGYNEHSIAYWSGAALGEMLYRGTYLARLNQEVLLDEESEKRLYTSFQVLAHIAPPQKKYPSLGDNYGPEVDPILKIGIRMLNHPACREVWNIRNSIPSEKSETKERMETMEVHSGSEQTEFQAESGLVGLDYCSDQAGFVCGKSGYDANASYFLMSAKNNCGYTGHNHMDMLSLFFTIHGVSIMDEPDSGNLYHNVCLGSPYRGFMYNMTSHNTVLAFGKPIAPDAMYADSWGVYRPDSPVTAYISRPEGMYAEAYHDAYTFCLHTRRVLFHRQKGIVIQDRIDRGNRYPADHIQRWHLAKGLKATVLNESALLLTDGNIQVLGIWDYPTSIRLYQDTFLYPEMVQNRSDLATVLDVSFRGEKEETLDYAATVLTAAFLDVTGCSLDEGSLAKLSRQLFSLMDASDMEQAIQDFDQLHTPVPVYQM